MLTAEDRYAIADLINRHGHLTDSGDFAAMTDLFTADVSYDVSALGGGVMVGLGQAREAALALGEANPLAHHVTNVVVEDTGAGTARARSKYLGVRSDGSVGSGTYEDTLHRLDQGWRIVARVVRPRRVPLEP